MKGYVTQEDGGCFWDCIELIAQKLLHNFQGVCDHFPSMFEVLIHLSAVVVCLVQGSPIDGKRIAIAAATAASSISSGTSFNTLALSSTTRPTLILSRPSLASLSMTLHDEQDQEDLEFIKGVEKLDELSLEQEERLARILGDRLEEVDDGLGKEIEKAKEDGKDVTKADSFRDRLRGIRKGLSACVDKVCEVGWSISLVGMIAAVAVWQGVSFCAENACLALMYSSVIAALMVTSPFLLLKMLMDEDFNSDFKNPFN